MKKEILLKQILNHEYLNGISMYYLIKNDYLNDIIEKIKNHEQFLLLLDHLLNRFDDYFPLLSSVKINIFHKLSTLDEMKTYLLSKHDLTNDTFFDYYEQIIKKIFTHNFISNIKMLEDIELKVFLKENKHLSMVELMKYLCFCSDKLDAFYLFDSIKDKRQKLKDKYAFDDETCIHLAKKDILMHYKNMIEDYHIKKEHISYFI